MLGLLRSAAVCLRLLLGAPARVASLLASRLSPALRLSTRSTSPRASAAARLLCDDALLMTITFLDDSDGRSAGSVCKRWHESTAAASQSEVMRVAELTATIRAGLFGSDEEQQAVAARKLRLASMRPRPFLPVLLDPAVVGKLISLLSDPDAELLIDCACILCNVASGPADETRMIVDLGAIPPLVELLGSDNADVQDNALGALANIAADSVEFRDRVLAAGVMPCITTIKPDAPIPLLRSAAFVLVGLCYRQPSPPWATIRPALPLLALLMQLEDEEVLSNAGLSVTQGAAQQRTLALQLRQAAVCDLMRCVICCCACGLRALQFLSHDHSPEQLQIQAVLDAGVAPRVVTLLSHPSEGVRMHAVRAVSNLVSGTDAQTQTMLEAGLLAALRPLVLTGSGDERTQALFIISNVTAENPTQITSVIDADLLPPIIALLSSMDSDGCKEAAWCVANILKRGSNEQLRWVVSLGVLPGLCSLLQASFDPPTLLVCLHGLERVLRLGAEDAIATHTSNLRAAAIESCGGVFAFDGLRSHDSPDVAALASVLMSYWPHAMQQ